MSLQVEKVNKDKSVDLLGKQGTTWQLILTVTNANNNPINLTGYTARRQEILYQVL